MEVTINGTAITLHPTNSEDYYTYSLDEITLFQQEEFDYKREGPIKDVTQRIPLYGASPTKAVKTLSNATIDVEVEFNLQSNHSLIVRNQLVNKTTTVQVGGYSYQLERGAVKISYELGPAKSNSKIRMQNVQFTAKMSFNKAILNRTDIAQVNGDRRVQRVKTNSSSTDLGLITLGYAGQNQTSVEITLGNFSANQTDIPITFNFPNVDPSQPLNYDPDITITLGGDGNSIIYQSPSDESHSFPDWLIGIIVLLIVLFGSTVAVGVNLFYKRHKMRKESDNSNVQLEKETPK